MLKNFLKKEFIEKKEIVFPTIIFLIIIFLGLLSKIFFISKTYFIYAGILSIIIISLILILYQKNKKFKKFLIKSEKVYFEKKEYINKHKNNWKLVDKAEKIIIWILFISFFIWFFYSFDFKQITSLY